MNELDGTRRPHRLTRSGHLLAVLVLEVLALTLQPTRVRAAEITPLPQAFVQEVASHRTATNGLPPGAVQLVNLAPDNSPRVFAQGRWFVRAGGRWEPDPHVAASAAEEFRFLDPAGRPQRVPLPWTDVQQLLVRGGSNYIVTARDPYMVVDGRMSSLGWPSRMQVHQAALGPGGDLWLASSGGLFRQAPGGWAPVDVRDGLGRRWATEDVRGVVFDAAQRLWFATRAGVGCRLTESPTAWRFYEGKDGLPWNDFTGAAAGPDGAVWFGTRLGAIRFDGTDWHYRQGPGWLPSDDVRQIVVNAAGSAWFATAGGLGEIERRPLTLAAKAAHYEDEIARYVKRTPFGFVAEAALQKPGDRASANPQDSDNDGLWTAMYGAGECFGYGATKDPGTLVRARQAFEALRFLQKVTQGGTPPAAKGFVARTIRPLDWADPNVGRLAGDRAEQQRDALWKSYEPRWPKSADGKWYWKTDTSSDELDGHYFFYALYFDLCAETDPERDRVREVVRDLTDHLVEHAFTLTDIDGKPTRWGVYDPRAINRDPRWWAERGLNSLSMLSYLAVAEHVTGDPKYAASARELIDRHGYGQNLMFPKVQYGTGSGNHSDDEMAVMCFYNLLRHSRDPELKNQALYSFFAYSAIEAPELNPFFNFAYAACGRGQSVTNVWGVFPVSPWDGWFEDSAATLRGLPLDRLDWAHRNSHRLDVVRLPRDRAKDLYGAPETGRGHRVNGKVLPVENRHFGHWNTDPWDLDYGGQGGELSAGTVFLLPYYMGLYHGYIAKP